MVVKEKVSKKLMALLLAIALLVGAVPASVVGVFASQAAEFTVNISGYNESAKVTLTSTTDSTDTKTVDADNGKAVFETFVDDEKTYNLSIANLIGYEDYSANNIAIEGSELEVSSTDFTAIEKINVTGAVADENGNAPTSVTVNYSAYDGKVTGKADYNDGIYSFDAYKGVKYTVSYTFDDKYNTVANKTITPSDSNNELADIDLTVKTFNITTSAGSNGSISDSITGVEYGESKEITITANTGYRIDTVTGYGSDTEAYKGQQSVTIPISNIKQDYSISVSFYKQTYIVKFDVSKNGEVTYDTDKTALGGQVTDVTVDENGTVEFTAKANASEGYHVEKVTNSDNPLTDGSNDDTTYTDTVSNVTGEKTVIVTFAVNTYTVTTSSGDNGSVTTSNETVDYDGQAVITITPDSNSYMVDSVSVNGAEIDIETVDSFVANKDGSATYTISNIKANTSVNATFKEIPKDTGDWKDKISIIATSGSLISEKTNGNDIIMTYTSGSNVKIEPKTPYTYFDVKYSVPSGYKAYEGWKSNRTINSTKIIEVLQVKSGKYRNTINLDLGAPNARIIVLIDNTKPEVNDIPAMEWDKTGSYTVTGSVTDNTQNPNNNPSSGLDYVVWSKTSLSNDAVKAETENKTVITNGNYSFTLSGEQNQTYYIYAVDVAGNVSNAKQFTAKIDTTKPAVDNFEFADYETSDDTGIYASDNIKVTVTASDKDSTVTNSGVSKIQLLVNGNAYGEAVTVNSSNSATFTLKKGDFDNAKTVSAYAIDKAGNNSDVKTPTDVTTEYTSNKVTISTTEASVTVTNQTDGKYTDADNKDWYNGDALFTVAIDSNHSGVAIKKIELKLNGTDITADSQGNAINEGLSSTKTFSINTNQDGTLKTGANTITGRVTLKNGKKTNINGTLYIDTVKPDITNFEFASKGISALEKVLNFLTFGNFFNEKIEIKVTANDSGDSSGLKEITLYGDETALDTQPIIEGVATFVVPAEDIADETMHLNKEISAKATDNVNNVTADFIQPTTTNSETFANSGLMIETKKPVVNVTFLDAATDKNPATADTNKWYADDIDFNINIKDADSGIRKVDVKINDTAITTDKSSKNIAEEFNKKSEKTTELDFTVNTDQVDIKEDGSYTITVSVTDNAGNVSDLYTETIFKDIDKPSIIDFKFEATGYDKDTEVKETNQAPVQETTYGFYFIEDTKVTITSHDVEPTSGIKTISYYTVDKDGGKSQELSPLVDENNKIYFTIPADFKGQIYAKATDNVGNTPDEYSNPNSAVIESPEQHEKSSSVTYTLKETPYKDADGNNLYAANTTVGIEVVDSYSGIRQIDWEIVSPYDDKKEAGTVTVDNDGVVTSKAKEGYSADCIGEWTATNESNLVINLKNNITISNNSNNIKIKITLTDRAGNKTENVTQVLSIDKTAPKIAVQMNENDDEKHAGFFNVDRTADIYVYERNFKSEDFNYVVSRVDDNESKSTIKITPEFKKVGETVIDGVECYVYKMSYKFTDDGDYSFAVNAKDFADNKVEDKAVKYSSNKTTNYAAQNDADRSIDNKFTIDKTAPKISVSYDNNEVQNEKYFKAHRTATITIIEHNFDLDRVEWTRDSKLSGNDITDPGISWSHNGNTHIATIKYDFDGDFTFDVKMTDMAGNKDTGADFGASVAGKDFTIDTTYNEIVKVEGIKDGEVLGLNDGIVNPDATISIIINDVNLDNYNVKLTRSRVLVVGESNNNYDTEQENVKDNPEKQCVEDNVDVTSQFVSNASGNSNATAKITIPKRDKDGVKNDGIYTLTIEAKDKAGNAYDTQKNIIKFSANRFGSVFTFSDSLYKLITENDGYTQKLTSDDLTVYEYNTTLLTKENVEVIANNDSTTLEKSRDYKITLDDRQTDTSWSRFTYEISPENFTEDGTYTLRISSKDSASITSQTVDYDVCSATFRVDSTPADIISVNYSTEVNKIAGHDGGAAKAEKLDINFTVEDLIRLEKVEVYVDNRLQNTYVYGKDFDDFNTFDGGVITLNRSSNEQSVRIVATDKAGNVIDTDDEKNYDPGYVFFNNITVTTNQLVIWAKSPVFWAIVGAVVLAGGGLVFFILFKRRKKDDEEEPTAQVE